MGLRCRFRSTLVVTLAGVAWIALALAFPARASAKGKRGLVVQLSAPTDVRTAFGPARVRAGEVEFHPGGEVAGAVPPGRVPSVVRSHTLLEGVLDRPVRWLGVDIPAGSEVQPPAPRDPAGKLAVRFTSRRALRGWVFDELSIVVAPRAKRAFFGRIAEPVGDSPAPAVLETFDAITGRLADPASLRIGRDALRIPAGATVDIGGAAVPHGAPSLIIESQTPFQVRPGLDARRVAFDLASGELVRVGRFGDARPELSNPQATILGFPVPSESEMALYPDGSVHELRPADTVTLRGFKLGVSGRWSPVTLSLWPHGAPQCGLTSEDPSMTTFVDARTGIAVSGLNPVVLFDPRGEPRLVAHFPGGSYEILQGSRRGARRSIRPLDPADPLAKSVAFAQLSDCERLPPDVVAWLGTH